MKMNVPVLTLAAFAVAFAVPGFADTRTSEQAPAAQEHKASPSNPTKQEEETTEAHSTPDSHPQASGSSSSRGASKDKPAKKAKKKPKADKTSSSAGASRPQASLGEEKERIFNTLDLDGDGKVSLSEAAGNSSTVMGFDRADRNHDGSLDRREFARLGEKTKRARTASRSASR